LLQSPKQSPIYNDEICLVFHQGPSYFDIAEEFDDYPEDHLEQQIENHMQVAADLPTIDLELFLTPLGHAYGALVVYLIGMRRVRAALRRLKLALLVPGHRCRVRNFHNSKFYNIRVSV
jgi:rhodanese-related sulfurtransferase